ncbi:response regulator [Idiomarina sp. M1R2S28]|uniref:Response regulator n=1 Tax=Idiomarina rhizosphaerae TaxID=2961572 RepID=A0A9X2JTW4_9GAMM|nr:response regulator [Idiomarina rhizosphaerae]MCP1338416.1 response regulator [Idiomarina rhizosphaerae]
MKVLICDDSKVARKSIELALPKGWNIEVRFAENGQEALDVVEQGLAELLFLDLTMPVMDGFEVLRRIKEKQLDCLTIVVSGDIQEASQREVEKLGALGFIKKPIVIEELHSLLERYGLIKELLPENHQREEAKTGHIEPTDILKEMSNIALGDAAKLLGDMLGSFIQLPVPDVAKRPYDKLINELHDEDYRINMVSEGFVGNAIAGEAILCVDNRTFNDLPSKLSDYHGYEFQDDSQSVFLDVASTLIAAFLKSFSSQLDLELNISQPAFLGMSETINNVFKEDVKDKQVLIITIDYEIPDYNLNCDLFVIFTESSIAALEERAGYFIDE